MEDKRNLQVTINQAREWYEKGGEWRKLALSAFNEDEITKMDYLSYANLHAPDRKPLTNKVVEEKREEMGVLLKLHNLASIMNKGEVVSNDSPGYYIKVRQTIKREDGRYKIPKCMKFFLDVDCHKSIKHPGIAYFKYESDARKALEMLKSELESVYIK